MKLTIASSLIVLTLLISLVTAQNKILELNFVVYKNDTTMLENIAVTEGLETTLPAGNYSIRVVDFGGNEIVKRSFNIRFIQFTEPPKLLESVPVVLRIPFSTSIDSVELLHDTKVLYQSRISDLLCNKNNICDEFENYQSCAQDCPSGSKDNYCDQILDSRCDPDCAKDVDIDCTCGNNVCDVRESVITCPKDCKKESSNVIIYSILGIAFISLIIILFNRRKGRK